MFRDLTNIIYDKKLRITLIDNCMSINNYEEILIFEDNQVLIKAKNKTIKVKGESLSITRLENNEVRIEGKIKTIDLGD